jgi:tetratricopeptide (TPR) repeat protein
MNEEAIEAFDRALEAFFRASKPMPIDATIWYNKGIVLKARNKNKKGYQEAIHAYNRAIELDPLKLEAWNNKGWIFFEQGLLSAAIESYKKALEINPNDKQVWKNKYLALNSLSRYYEVISDYVSAFKYKYEADEALKRSEDLPSYIYYTDHAFIERNNILKTMREK